MKTPHPYGEQGNPRHLDLGDDSRHIRKQTVINDRIEDAVVVAYEQHRLVLRYVLPSGHGQSGTGKKQNNLKDTLHHAKGYNVADPGVFLSDQPQDSEHWDEY